MRKTIGWVGLVGIGVFGVAGCGTSSVPVEDVGDEFVSSFCEQVRRCPEQWRTEFGALANIFEAGLDDVRCEDVLANIPELGRAPAEVAGVEGGTIAYDAAQARRCIRALANSCVPIQASVGLPECQGVFTGLAEVGDSCSTTSECEPTAYCELTDQCEGTCAARATVGQACTGDEECLGATGTIASCQLVDGNEVCVQVAIAQGAAVGESCGIVDNDGTERTTTVCDEGLYCRLTGVSAGSCALPVAAGENCESNDVCERGYLCDEGSCRTVTFADSVGAPCNPDARIFCDGSLGLACDEASESCVAVGDGTVGSPCTSEDDSLFSLVSCDRGLFCDRFATTPTCKEPFENGAICLGNLQCDSGYCIDGECSPPVLCTVDVGPI